MVRLVPQLVFFMFFLCFIGCTSPSGGPAINPDETPLQRAIRTSQTQRQRAAKQARLASNSRSSYRVKLRYNPGRCKVPGFEVAILGRWVRVRPEPVQGTPTTQVNLFRQQQSQPNARTEVLWVRGALLSSRTYTDERGIQWPIFRVDAIESRNVALRSGRPLLPIKEPDCPT